MNDDNNAPALTLDDVNDIVKNIMSAARDRDVAVTRVNVDRLTGYIEYLARMGCDGGCGRRIAYVSAFGHVLCWTCADDPRVHSDADELAERYHCVAAAAEWLDENGDPDGEATTALMVDVLAIVGENTELVHSERVRTIAARAIPRHAAGVNGDSCEGCNPPDWGSHLLEAPDDGEPDPYPDAVAGLAEAATWAKRWAHERGRANEAAAEGDRVGELHKPYTDEHGRTRCAGCIAGYDPATGELTRCAWPCPTERARRGEGP